MIAAPVKRRNSVQRPKSARPPGMRRPPRGVTLVELLIAMAISLIMMAAVANLFAVMTSSVSASRASIGLSESLRAVRNRMQADLAGATADTLPPLRPEESRGYFNVFEGPSVDYTAYHAGTATAAANIDSLTGDADDVLTFTTRAKGTRPFIGKFFNNQTQQTVTVESQVAEVAWFTIQNGRTVALDNQGNQAQLFTLYRRALVVAPEYNTTGATSGNPLVAAAANSPYTFFNEYDVSAHYDMNQGGMVLNSLADLTKRENRFAHDPSVFPFPLYLPPPIANLGVIPTFTNGSNHVQAQTLSPLTAAARVGEDVVLTNVLSFDVKVYDPTAVLYDNLSPNSNPINNIVGLVPSDIGYWNATGNPVAGYGAFVDLGYGVTAGQGQNQFLTFFNYPTVMPGVNARVSQWGANGGTYPAQVFYPEYDTWSLHHEANGGAVPGQGYSNFNSSGTVISGTNGFDDNNDGVVDDPNEFQFPPPYSAPLRGIQVKIRTYEPDSKQVREVTIVQDFLPQ